MRCKSFLTAFIRRILMCMIIVLVALSTSSCIDSTRSAVIKDNSNISDKQKIKLRFINSWGGVDPQSDLLNQIFKEFMEKYPNIEVINESVYGEDFLPKIKTDFASGNDPDVFGLWPGSDIRALIEAGKVADLTELLNTDKEWKGRFKSNAWSYTTFQDKIYGLPYEIIFECLFINKDLFDWYDIKVPKNYEELKSTVKAFRTHNIIPIAYNYMAEGSFLYQNIIASLGGKHGVENPIQNGHIKDCYIKAMDYMKELYQLHAFPDKALKMDNKERDNLFLTKQAAMIVQGSWFIGRLQDANNGKVDIIPFPDLDGKKPDNKPLIYGFGSGTFYISKAAWDNNDKRSASILLLKELTSEKWVSKFADAGGISNINTDVTALNYNLLRKKGLAFIDSAAELIGPPDSFVNRTGWEDIIVKQFPFVLEGRMTSKELWNMYMGSYPKAN